MQDAIDYAIIQHLGNRVNNITDDQKAGILLATARYINVWVGKIGLEAAIEKGLPRADYFYSHL